MSTTEATPAVPAEAATRAVDAGPDQGATAPPEPPSDEQAASPDDSPAGSTAATPEITEYERDRGKPLPSLNHGYLQAALTSALFAYRDTYTITSEVTLDLADGAVTPDICLFELQPIAFDSDVTRMSEPPLLAVEIASPSQSTSDIVTKITRMLDAGVQSCWLVQPAMQTVTVYTKGQRPRTFDSGTVADPHLDVEVDVRSLFDVATPAASETRAEASQSEASQSEESKSKKSESKTPESETSTSD